MNNNLIFPHGIITAALTPMRKDFSVDHDVLASHLHWLLENGSDGICLMGTTGEANSLTVQERTEVVDRVIENGIPPEKLLVGTGLCAFPDTVKLTLHAAKKEVGGVLMLPPFYYKQIDDQGLKAYFDLVVGKVNNPNLRIYLYHFPKMTGLSFSIPLVKQLIEAHPGVFVGMKDSSGNLDHMKSFSESIPSFEVYAGTEKYLLDILESGGAGCISATANATCKLAAEICKEWTIPDIIQKQSILTTIREAMECQPFVPGLKHLFAHWTKNEQWIHMRPPHIPLTMEQAAPLIKGLENLDFRIENY